MVAEVKRAAALAMLAALAGAGPLQAGPPGGGGEPCPSRSFPDFLRSFSESAAVQRAFTYFPLKVSHVVDGTDEPETVTGTSGRGSVR